MILFLCGAYMIAMYATFTLACDHARVLIPRLVASVCVLLFTTHVNHGLTVFAGLFACFELYSTCLSNPLERKW